MASAPPGPRAAAAAPAPGGGPGGALRHGLRLLARSARTERGLRERLARRFGETAAAQALERLRALGYVDDRAWAAAYVLRPRSLERSARLLRRELRARGVAPALAAAAVAGHDDDRAARLAARLALRRLAPPRAADGGRAAARRRAQRLRGALARRGFGPETIRRALADAPAEAPDGPRAASAAAPRRAVVR